MQDPVPFAITATIETPVILPDGAYLTLDALLERASEGGPIPLVQYNRVWMGSAAFLVDPRPLERSFVSSMQLHGGDYNHDPRKKVLRTGGPDMADIDRYPAFEVSQITWFGLGYPGECVQLVQSLPGIGKKVAHGFGAINRVEAVHLEVDRSIVLPDGTPARPIPMTHWAEMRATSPELADPATLPTDDTSVIPPYWDPDNRAFAVLPRHRALSRQELARINTGVAPPSFPDLQNLQIEFSNNETAVSFFVRHVGRKLAAAEGVPGNTAKLSHSCAACGSTKDLQRAGNGYTTLCGDCYTFGGSYQKIKRPGRMGAGWMGLVSADGARFATSVEYSPDERPFQSIDGCDIVFGKPALQVFLKDVLTSPPSPPFLLFVGDQSSVKVLRNLKVTYSLRRVHVGSKTLESVDAISLQENLEYWRSSNIPLTTLKRAVRLLNDYRYAYASERKEEAYSKLKRLVDLDTHLPFLRRLPATHTADWRYFSRFANQEEQSQRVAQ